MANVILDFAFFTFPNWFDTLGTLDKVMVVGFMAIITFFIMIILFNGGGEDGF